jgi:hypothetical protein
MLSKPYAPFWRAADIALEDKPQLKEALMKGV